jgi:hypothetical protein
MSPMEIIEQATVEGVTLSFSPAGKLTAIGEQTAVDKWLPTIRDNKPSILYEIHREYRRTQVLAKLEAEPSTRYAVNVADASTDPVIATVGIRDVATFEMAMPRHSYDGMVLLLLIEEYYEEKYATT